MSPAAGHFHANPSINPKDRRRVLLKRIRNLAGRGVGISSQAKPKLLRKLHAYEGELRLYPPPAPPKNPPQPPQ